MPTDRTRSLAPLAIGITMVLWASAFVGIRALAGDFSPGPLSLGRLVVGSLALGVLAVVRKAVVPWPTAAQWRRIAVVGVLWFAVYNVALNEAERSIDAGTAALLLQFSPLLIALLAAMMLGEKLTGWLVAGIAIALAGIVVITVGSGGIDTNASVWGVVLCLVCCVAYSVSVIAQKPLLTELTAVQVTWLACVVGALCCVPFAPALITEVSRAPLGSVLWLVYLGVFPTAVAFTTYAYALGRMKASSLGVTTYLVPPIAIGLSWLLLGEVPTVLVWLGGALTLVGVAVARRQPA